MKPENSQQNKGQNKVEEKAPKQNAEQNAEMSNNSSDRPQTAIGGARAKPLDLNTEINR